MADAPKLLGTDTLRTAYPKVNMAIDNANEALRNSEQALANSENTQAQLDQIVIEGDSSVEAAQARVDADGNVFTTLKERLDTKETQFAADINTARTEPIDSSRLKENNIPASKLKISTDADKIKLIHLSDEVKQAMAGTTPVNATPGPNSVTTEKIAPGAVTWDKINGAVRGKNLFNKDTVINNAYIHYLDGQVVTGHPTYCASDFIPVEPNTDYYFTKVINQHYAFYDINKNWIGPSTNGGASTGQVVRTPANAAYMRVTLNMTDVASAQIEKGTAGTSYEPYGYTIDYLVLKSSNIPDGIIDKNHIKDQAVSLKSIEGAELGKNLFNKDNVTPDKYVMYSNGQLGDNTNYVATDYIEVEPNTQYTRNYSHQMAFYDANKTYISGINVDWSNTGVTTFTTPANAKYVRLTVAKTAVDTFQLEKGSVATSYEPYGYKIKYLNTNSDKNYLLGPLDVVLPRKVYLLKDKTYNFFFRNLIKSLNPLINIRLNTTRGTHLKDKYSYTPTTLESFSFEVALKDMYFNTIKNKAATIEVVDKTTATPVNILAIGDSITRNGKYVKTVQDELPNVKAVGTRQYSGETFAREGRGGWTLASYFNNIGMTTTVDSPFLFPVGVPGSKYWGNTEAWKKICYTDPTGYDYDGFQRIAKGWNGTDFLFDVNGYPLNPSVDDVVIDPTKPAGSGFLKWDGSAWVTMDPQPTVEFNFSKYMERYAAAFGTDTPNVVSFLLGTNDFMHAIGIDGGISSYISYLRQAINSIHAYDPNIKIIINMPILGNTQDFFSNTYGTSINDYQFNRNMQDLGLRIVSEFDNDTDLANKIYVCPLHLNLDVNNLTDHVHPNDNGHTEMGLMLAALVQKIR